MSSCVILSYFIFVFTWPSYLLQNRLINYELNFLLFKLNLLYLAYHLIVYSILFIYSFIKLIFNLYILLLLLLLGTYWNSAEICCRGHSPSGPCSRYGDFIGILQHTCHEVLKSMSLWWTLSQIVSSYLFNCIYHIMKII